MALATFGAGCFWGVELTFSKLPGVISTSVGYMGGHTDQPTYKEVCTDSTGHAEVVQVEYDPERLDYERLLATFFQSHDPTQHNRQGPDIGSQYRSAIFYHDETQRQIAADMLATLKAQRPMVTQLEAAQPYYWAEDYHQKYLEKRGAAHCGF